MKFLKANWPFLLAVAIMVPLGGYFLGARNSRPAPKTQSVVRAEKERVPRDVILYFSSVDGPFLLAESRQMEGCLEEETCLADTVSALIAGPQTDLVPVLPQQTLLRQVSVEGGNATLDFSSDIIKAHPGGSASELLTVYSLANTVAVNFPHIREVKLLVEGNPVDTLKGHVDLRGTIKADFQYTRTVEESLEEKTLTGGSAATEGIK